jgi:hypothetical protein
LVQKAEESMQFWESSQSQNILLARRCLYGNFKLYKLLYELQDITGQRNKVNVSL